VLNVATNAIDACVERADGKVSIATDYNPRESRVRIVVEDNGCGIPQEELDKIFTIFVSNKGGRGTGLGLPVSQKILKEHGGDIRVASRVGEGSSFTLEFPASTPPPAAAKTGTIPIEKS
jgi:signal transduction histidine kinase